MNQIKDLKSMICPFWKVFKIKVNREGKKEFFAKEYLRSQENGAGSFQENSHFVRNQNFEEF